MAPDRQTPTTERPAHKSAEGHKADAPDSSAQRAADRRAEEHERDLVQAAQVEVAEEDRRRPHTYDEHKDGQTESHDVPRDERTTDDLLETGDYGREVDVEAWRERFGPDAGPWEQDYLAGPLGPGDAEAVARGDAAEALDLEAFKGAAVEEGRRAGRVGIAWTGEVEATPRDPDERGQVFVDVHVTITTEEVNHGDTTTTGRGPSESAKGTGGQHPQPQHGAAGHDEGKGDHPARSSGTRTPDKGQGGRPSPEPPAAVGGHGPRA